MSLNLDSDYTMTLNGRAESSPQTFDVLNPATEERIAAAPDASLDQLNAAIAAARAAFGPWRDRPIGERQTVLRNMAGLLEDHADGFMRLLTREQGKPHADARAEVACRAPSPRTVRAAWASGAGRRRPGACQRGVHRRAGCQPDTARGEQRAKLSSARDQWQPVGAIAKW